MNNFHDRRTLSDIFMEWYVRTQGQGAGASKPRQPKRWTLADYKEHNAVPIAELLENDYYFGKRGKQLYECHRRDIIELCERKMRGEDIRVFIDEEGWGAGKTWKLGFLNGLFLFKNIIIPDFGEAYPKLSSDTKLGFWLASKTKQHGIDMIFKEAMDVILQSDFFTDHFPPSVTKAEIEAMKRNPSVLRFWGNKIGLGVGSGQFGELNAQGYNIIFAGFDEINFFPLVKRSVRTMAEDEQGNKFDSAEQAYSSAFLRITSRFTYKGLWPIWSLICAVTSVRGDGDFTDAMIVKAKDGRKDIMYRRRAAFETYRRNLSGKTFKIDVKNMKIVNIEECEKRYYELIGMS